MGLIDRFIENEHREADDYRSRIIRQQGGRGLPRPPCELFENPDLRVLLIAIAYTCAALQGIKIKRSGQQKYVNRLKVVVKIIR